LKGIQEESLGIALVYFIDPKIAKMGLQLNNKTFEGKKL